MSLIIRNVQIISPGSPLHGATEIGIDQYTFVDPLA